MEQKVLLFYKQKQVTLIFVTSKIVVYSCSIIAKIHTVRGYSIAFSATLRSQTKAMNVWIRLVQSLHAYASRKQIFTQIWDDSKYPVKMSFSACKPHSPLHLWTRSLLTQTGKRVAYHPTVTYQLRNVCFVTIFC